MNKLHGNFNQNTTILNQENDEFENGICKMASQNVSASMCYDKTGYPQSIFKHFLCINQVHFTKLGNKTRTTRTPGFWGYPLPPHDYPYHWVILDPKSRQSQSYKFKKIRQNFKFWNGHYMRHTFLSCLIRCANMKWIWWVLLKIQSGHFSVHRRTGWYQYTPGGGGNHLGPLLLTQMCK